MKSLSRKGRRAIIGIAVLTCAGVLIWLCVTRLLPWLALWAMFNTKRSYCGFEDVRVVRLHVESLDVSLDVPQGFVQIDYDPVSGEDREEVDLCSEWQYYNARSPCCFHIEAAESIAEDVSDWESVDLDDGGVFHYWTEPRANPGSGGDVDALVGYAIVSGRTYRIWAYDQGEPGPPDSTWCVPYIETLRYEGE